MPNKIKSYASLVTFSHTVFAMPFALISFFYASQGEFSIWLLVKVLMCMIFARNAAMAFNRYADRDIDAKNPRTAAREIPSGKISPRSALIFIMLNVALFVATTYFINTLAFALSPIALLIILGYTLTKRFTSLCHLVIGLSLSVAPIGAYIAVRGEFATLPLMLSGLVLTWVSGFDIIYSLQDTTFDRENGVNSIPSKIGIKRALYLSTLLHLLSIAMVVAIGIFIGGGILYWIGATLFTLLLTYQHLIVKPNNLSRINLAFGTLNGVAGVLFAIFFIVEITIRFF